MNGQTDLSARAASFLSGECLSLAKAKAPWEELQKCNQI